MDPLLLPMVANDLEPSTLSALRNALLPKLLSCEIRVKDADKLVEREAP